MTGNRLPITYAHDFAFMLKSFAGDFDYAQRLIKSFRAFNVDNIPLFIVVPEEDISMFSRFTSETTVTIAEESLKFDYVQDDRVRGIRPGYINQEVVKLSFWQTGLAENYFCLDSDAEFIRTFRTLDFVREDGVPYSVLVEDKELQVDREYRKQYWIERSRLIDAIKNACEYIDARSLTCHGATTLSSIVLQDFWNSFLRPRNWNVTDAFALAPYEFSWYSIWLQKCNLLPVLVREPYFKVFHTRTQHEDYLRRSISRSDIAVAYLGIIINSNYSRPYGIVSYEDGNLYRKKASFRKRVIRRVRKFVKRLAKAVRTAWRKD